jgi:hypothetical protein
MPMEAMTPLRQERCDFPRGSNSSLRADFNYFPEGSTDFSFNVPIKVKTILREK